VKKFAGVVLALVSLTTAIGGQAPEGASPTAHEIVFAHNAVRQRLGLPELAWSDQLAQVAQGWADTLIQNGEFAHRRNPQFGENLYEITGGTVIPSRVVNAWAAEVASYNVQENSCAGMCGHYTQLVWRETKSVGCGMARDGRRDVWVCNYDPAGNYVGERPY
jgi:uncharacterized protein YkwD